MNAIVIRNQEEWDNLPSEFREFTVLEIRSELRIVISSNSKNSSAVLRENSSAVLWGNSSADAFSCATLFVFSTFAMINKLLDNAHLIYKAPNCKRPLLIDSTTKVTEFEKIITPTFEQWLERGYVAADGINQKLVNQKTIGDLSVFETTDFFEKEKFIVVKKGEFFAHGKTFEEAKDALKYKLSDRDTSKYRSWQIDEQKPLEEMIQAYMAVTGACGIGTKPFCDSVQLKETYSPKEVIELTSGRYGHEKFKKFWEIL
jgi:hypothetical protein